MIKLSIIIVNWNTAKLLRQCLDSVISDLCLVTSNNKKQNSLPIANHQSLVTEIIVVDNGSTDKPVEMVKSLPTTNHQSPITLRLITNEENLGFAKGNNIGIKEAKGEYIMLLNSDTIVKEGAIEKLLETFTKQADNVGAISPLLLNSDGSVQKDPCYLKFPSPLLVLFYYNRILKTVALKLFPKLLFSVVDFSKPSLVDQLPGAAIVIRKKVLDEIGGFDEEFEIYFEDSDLCMRMKKAGYLLLLEPLARVVHLGRQSIKPLVAKEGIEKFYLLNFESLFRFCKKHYSSMKYISIKTILLLQFLLSGEIGLFIKLIT